MKPRIIGLVALLICSSKYSMSQIYVSNFIPEADTAIIRLSSLSLKEKFDQVFEINTARLYGGGSLLNSTTSSNDQTTKNSVSGSIGLNISTDKLTCDIFFSYNNADTLSIYSKKNLGHALMNTSSLGKSYNAHFTYRPWAKFKYLGFTGGVNLNDQIWNTDSVKNIDATPITLSGGIIIIPFEKESNGNKLSSYLEVNLTSKSIKGDFNNSDFHIIEESYIAPRAYYGLDLTLATILNSTRFYVTASFNGKQEYKDYIQENNNTPVVLPGFSGTQIQLGVDVAGNITSLFNQNTTK